MCARRWSSSAGVASRCQWLTQEFGAGLLLYLLDVTLRMSQQMQPVKIKQVNACPSATLATLEFNTDPYTPVKPVQVCFVAFLGFLTSELSCVEPMNLAARHAMLLKAI